MLDVGCQVSTFMPAETLHFDVSSVRFRLLSDGNYSLAIGVTRHLVEGSEQRLLTN